MKVIITALIITIIGYCILKMAIDRLMNFFRKKSTTEEIETEE